MQETAASIYEAMKYFESIGGELGVSEWENVERNMNCRIRK
jgi:hypothetical protein